MKDLEKEKGFFFCRKWKKEQNQSKSTLIFKKKNRLHQKSLQKKLSLRYTPFSNLTHVHLLYNEHLQKFCLFVVGIVEIWSDGSRRRVMIDNDSISSLLTLDRGVEDEEEGCIIAFPSSIPLFSKSWQFDMGEEASWLTLTHHNCVQFLFPTGQVYSIQCTI